MSLRNPSRIHGVDAAALTADVRDAIDGPLLSLVEFDRSGFNPLFVHETTVAMYRDEEQMLDHFEEIHGFINLDLTEMSLFTDHVIPRADRVRALSTTLDVVQLVRVYVGERGFFLALGPDEALPPVLEAIESAVDA